jgi:competence protein ComEC
MRAVWCGFALGVIALQQQAALPGPGMWLALMALAAVATICAAWMLRDPSRGGPLRFAAWAAVWLASGCVGFGYAAWRAELRLAEALPAAWQGREIDLTGHITRMLARDENSARFLFAVESWPPRVSGENLPHLIQLSWVVRDAPLPLLEPGARWHMGVRLKRPHSEGNFGLRDQEAALLSRGVRATGYVSDTEHAQRLAVDAQGVGVRIERIRSLVRERIDAVLAGAPHRGIVVALATGAQDAVSDADWRLLRNTGTSHLVAISGLHLAFVAGLAGWAVGALWRRARWRGVEAPLFVPA